MGDFNRAVQMNEDVIKKIPELDMPYINLGNYYIQRGDTATAVKNWETAVAERPTYEGAMQLNYLYKMHGDQRKADFLPEDGPADNRATEKEDEPLTRENQD